MPYWKFQHFAGIPSSHGAFLFLWIALTQRGPERCLCDFYPSYLLPMEQQGNRWAVIKFIVDSTSDCSFVNVLLQGVAMSKWDRYLRQWVLPALVAFSKTHAARESSWAMPYSRALAPESPPPKTLPFVCSISPSNTRHSFEKQE